MSVAQRVCLPTRSVDVPRGFLLAKPAPLVNFV
jgi:hypothetical protein